MKKRIQKNCILIMMTCVVVLSGSPPDCLCEESKFVAETRFGWLSIGKVGGKWLKGSPPSHVYFVFFKGEELRMQVHYTRVVAVHTLDAEIDVVLISDPPGGNACPSMFTLIDIRESGAKVVDTFGNCMPRIDKSWVQDGILYVEIKSSQPGIEADVFSYDGKTMSKAKIYENNAGVEMAGGGHDVSRWEGRRTFEIFDDKGERLRFLQIMGQSELDELREVTKVSTPATIQDGYLIVSGCKPHDCPSGHGAIAVELETGHPFAVMYPYMSHRDSSSEVRIFGGTLHELPRPLRDYALDPDANRP